MVLQTFGSDFSRPSATRPRTRGVLSVKLCALAAAVAIVLVPAALVKNAQRNLTESIRVEEARQRELLKDLNTADTRLKREMNDHRLERTLERQGLNMITPSAEQIVMVAPTAPGMAPTAPRHTQPHAVAAR